MVLVFIENFETDSLLLQAKLARITPIKNSCIRKKGLEYKSAKWNKCWTIGEYKSITTSKPSSISLPLALISSISDCISGYTA